MPPDALLPVQNGSRRREPDRDRSAQPDNTGRESGYRDQREIQQSLTSVRAVFL